MIKSVQRVHQILELIGDQPDGVTYKQVSGRLGYPHSSMWGLLSDLVTLEYLTFEPVTKRYSLGPQILNLAGRFLANHDIVQIGRPIIRRAVELTDESSLLVVRNGFQAIFVHRENCRNNSTLSTARIGQRAPLYATPSGKTMLAHFSAEELNQYLAETELIPLTPRTITKPNRLKKDLEGIRQGAVAYSREEYKEGMTGLGAPVFDINSRVRIAMDIVVPTYRTNKEKEAFIEQVLRDLSHEFSHRLGYHGRERPPAG